MNLEAEISKSIRNDSHEIVNNLFALMECKNLMAIIMCASIEIFEAGVIRFGGMLHCLLRSCKYRVIYLRIPIGLICDRKMMKTTKVGSRENEMQSE